MLDDAVCPYRRGRQDIALCLYVFVNSCRQRDTVYFLRLKETGTDRGGLGDAERRRRFGDALPLFAQLNVPAAGLELPGLGDLDNILLLALPELLSAAPLAVDGVIINGAGTAFTLQINHLLQVW